MPYGRYAYDVGGFVSEGAASGRLAPHLLPGSREREEKGVLHDQASQGPGYTNRGFAELLWRLEEKMVLSRC